jgi:hypothetical protein
MRFCFPPSFLSSDGGPLRRGMTDGDGGAVRLWERNGTMTTGGTATPATQRFLSSRWLSLDGSMRLSVQFSPNAAYDDVTASCSVTLPRPGIDKHDHSAVWHAARCLVRPA